MPSFLTSVPVLLGKPINVWLGVALLLLITLQVSTGMMIYRGNPRPRPIHRLNAMIIVSVIVVHAYYGIGVWFFGMRYP